MDLGNGCQNQRSKQGKDFHKFQIFDDPPPGHYKRDVGIPLILAQTAPWGNAEILICERIDF